MTEAELKKAFELYKSIELAQKNLVNIESILENYKAGDYTFEGIRLYSYKKPSVDLDNNLVSFEEVLTIYINRLKERIDSLQNELTNLMLPKDGNLQS